MKITVIAVGKIKERFFEEAKMCIRDSYLCSTFDEKYEEALKLAIEAGKKKAESMAEAGGCSIGQTISISELSSDQSARPVETKVMALETASVDMEGDMNAMAAMGGEVEIEASVSIDFAIK